MDSIGVPYALIGGHAVAVRGYIRSTLDYDFLTTDKRALDPAVWQSLTGATVDARRGDFDDQLTGVVHIRLADGTDVDIVVAKWKWERAVIDRAERLSIGVATVPVPRTADLILLKLAAGGPHDLRDAAILLEVEGRRHQLIAEVEEHIAEVRPDVTEVWKQILAG